MSVPKYNELYMPFLNVIRLANLMIEYELGVSTQYEYKVKRLDTDYFSED